MNTRILNCLPLNCAVLLVLGALTVSAQTVNTTVLRAVAAAATNTTRTTNTARATPKASSVLPPELTNAIHTMSFDRSSEALFAAVKAQQAGGKLSESEKFRLALLLGDWTHIGEALKTLPAEDATLAHARLLDSLTTNSQSASQFFAQSRAGAATVTYDQFGNAIPAAQQPQPSTRRGLFLSDDLYAVIEASPAELTESHMSSLASLVKVAIGNAGRGDFLSRLEKGLKGIGGPSPSGRKLAAQLLSSVGWMSDAGPYLPLNRSDWDNADTLSLVLTLEYFTQAGVEKRDERQLKRAAELCAFMMQTSRFSSNDRGIFKQATDRFVKLLPALEADEAEQLIRENFLTQPTIMTDLILAIGDVGHQTQKGTDLKAREQSLATQKILLRVLDAKKSALPEAVNVLVMNWLGEAEQTYRAGGRNQEQNIIAADYYIYRNVNVNTRPRTLSPEVVLEHAPSKSLIRRMNQGLAQRVNLTLLKVTLLEPTEMTLETLRNYLKDHPGQEKELCEDYLAAWVKKRTVQQEDPNIVRMRLLGYSVARPPAQGIPLTRLRQNQNVAEFKQVLAALRELSPEPIEAQSIINSFMGIHSGAEVYRLEDIETIFGPAEKMNRAELMSLVTGMRTKLAEQWRDPQAQQTAGSNRTETEVKDEVSRGYRTALELVKRGLSATNAEWKQFIVRGQLFFDASEYEFSRQIKLSDYVNLRDEAFSSYKKAADLYAATVPELPKGQWTMEPYQMWFFVMLGASDLSQLTRAAARSDPGLKLVGDAMRALPGEAAEGHLEQFGEMLGNVLSQVPANMKQKFLSAGLQVIGENHPSAKKATESLANYQELIDEVQLRLAVDGPTRVGRTLFGAFVSLDHTRQLARESGGFTKYLQNLASQARNVYFINSGIGKAVNYRDEFTKNIHAALDETFEIVSVTFHDAAVKPIDLPREGWQETPLAYLVLRAKDSAVDRIPSFQLDMEFSDTAGQVVLPVRSQVQPIDAKDSEAAQRPCEDLSLTFVMDEREWRKEGKVVIEVAAKARGVIPSHTQMFEFERPGFDLEVTDNGLSVTQFTSDGRTKTAQSDRGWQFTYTRKKDLRGDVTLPFPAIKSGFNSITNVDYKHYQDADLVSLDAKEAAAGVVLRSGGSSLARNLGLGVGALALAVGVLVLARRRPKSSVAGETLRVPEQLTPFSAVAFLRRIQSEYHARLDEEKRGALRSEIRAIESAYFSGPQAANPAPDLNGIARKWAQAVA